jgi:tetratricopeptide (TPR) repeat protein
MKQRRRTPCPNSPRPGCFCEESLANFRTVGGAISISTPLNILGGLALQRGDLDTARSLLQESLAIRRDLNDAWECSHLLNTLGDVERTAGRLAEARSCYEESLVLSRQVGSGEGVPTALHNLGVLALTDGDTNAAGESLAASLSAWREVGEERGIAESLASVGALAARLGQLEHAARLIGACDALLALHAAEIWHTNAATYQRTRDEVTGALGASSFAAHHEAGRSAPLDQMIAEALAVASTA